VHHDGPADREAEADEADHAQPQQSFNALDHEIGNVNTAPVSPRDLNTWTLLPPDVALDQRCYDGVIDRYADRRCENGLEVHAFSICTSKRDYYASTQGLMKTLLTDLLRFRLTIACSHGEDIQRATRPYRVCNGCGGLRAILGDRRLRAAVVSRFRQRAFAEFL